jgi:hypothetical protein
MPHACIHQSPIAMVRHAIHHGPTSWSTSTRRSFTVLIVREHTARHNGRRHTVVRRGGCGRERLRTVVAPCRTVRGLHALSARSTHHVQTNRMGLTRRSSGAHATVAGPPLGESSTGKASRRRKSPCVIEGAGRKGAGGRGKRVRLNEQEATDPQPVASKVRTRARRIPSLRKRPGFPRPCSNHRAGAVPAANGCAHHPPSPHPIAH